MPTYLSTALTVCFGDFHCHTTLNANQGVCVFIHFLTIQNFVAFSLSLLINMIHLILDDVYICKCNEYVILFAY